MSTPEHESNHEPQRPRLSSIALGAWRRLPVTCALVFAASMCFSAAFYLQEISEGIDAKFHHPGSLVRLELVDFPEINGAFDLWRGEWWRLIANAFHHGGLMHLGMNCLSLWLLGGLLEPRMGAGRYGLFCLAAAIISAMPEVLIEQSAIGLSGVVFAQFGLLLVIRNRDEDIAATFTPGIIKWGFVFLFACIPVTMAGWLNIANGAHLAGVVYGAAVGFVCYELPHRSGRLTWPAFLMLHVALGGCLWVLMNPFWNGRYLVWQVIAGEKESSLEVWQQATKREPGLAVAWESQAEILLDQGDRQAAWEAALRGLKFNRTSDRLKAMARRIWREEFDPGVERFVALESMRKMFSHGELNAWKDQLGLVDKPIPTEEAIAATIDEFLADELLGPHDLRRKLDVPEHVSGITRPHLPDSAPGEVDPDDPSSALLGTRL